MSATGATAGRSDLPHLVSAYIERNLPEAALATHVRFSQVGEMQLKPGRWSRFTAEQEAAIARVEFSWRASFPVAPLVKMRVKDGFGAGRGALEVRLFRLPLKRLEGAELARGEAMRYLAELPWVPQAFVANRELEWTELDDTTVEVATRVAGSRAAMRLHFNESGDIVAASAPDRPRAIGKRSVPTPFAGDFGDYRSFDGVRIPTIAAVRWELAEGPFVYFRGRVTSFAAS